MEHYEVSKETYPAQKMENMYEVADIQDYRQKWLKAECELAINWVEFQSASPNYEPIGNVDKDISTDSFHKEGKDGRKRGKS